MRDAASRGTTGQRERKVFARASDNETQLQQPEAAIGCRLAS